MVCKTFYVEFLIGKVHMKQIQVLYTFFSKIIQLDFHKYLIEVSNVNHNGARVSQIEGKVEEVSKTSIISAKNGLFSEVCESLMCKNFSKRVRKYFFNISNEIKRERIHSN